MRYGEVISRSFAIFWRHKYLWLLGALGGGESVGGGASFFNLLGSGPGGGGGGGNQVSPEVAAELNRWFLDNLVLLIVLLALLAVLTIAYFLLSCLTTGAAIRASAEHDAERPFDFGTAWRAGRQTFWSILGLRLLSLLFGLVVLALFGVLAVVGFSSAAAGQNAGAAVAAVLGVLLFLLLIPVAIGFGLTWTLATRSVVLEQRPVLAAVGRGFQLLTGRLGRVLLLWLISIALSIAIGIALGVALLVLALPLAGVVFAAAINGGLEPALTVGAVAVAIYILVSVVVSGAAGSYLTAYWTLAFRRLEMEAPAAAPPYYYPAQPQPPY
jgi:hypothetical protein